MTAEALIPYLLLVQGVLGGADTLLNHELIERLPYRVSARREIGLHSIREAIYATLFCGLAWNEWHGMLALAIAALVLAEVLVTASDEFVENHSRVLPNNERVLHVFLTLNLGLIIALLVPTLLQWSADPTGFEPRDEGWISWALTGLGAAAAAWSLRDLVAWRRLSMARI
jgi:uncharacterized protein